jgi:hypothetical protein
VLIWWIGVVGRAYEVRGQRLESSILGFGCGKEGKPYDGKAII